MAQDFRLPAADDQTISAPLLWISHQGFQRATGEDLRAPVRSELMERLRRGLAALDNDFPGWLEGIDSETEAGLTLRFRDAEAVRNVASKLVDRGLTER